MINIAFPFPSANYSIKNRLTPEEINAPLSSNPVKDLARFEANEERRRQEHNANPPGPHTLKTLSNLGTVPAIHEATFLSTLPYIGAMTAQLLGSKYLTALGRNPKGLSIPTTALATLGTVAQDKMNQFAIKPMATFAANLAHRLGTRMFPALVSAAADNPETETESPYVPYTNDSDKTISDKLKTAAGAAVKNWTTAGSNLLNENLFLKTLIPKKVSQKLGGYLQGLEQAQKLDDYYGLDYGDPKSYSAQLIRAALEYARTNEGKSRINANSHWNRNDIVMLGGSPFFVHPPVNTIDRLRELAISGDGAKMPLKEVFSRDPEFAIANPEIAEHTNVSFYEDDPSVGGYTLVDDMGWGDIKLNKNVYLTPDGKQIIPEKEAELSGTMHHEGNHGIWAIGGNKSGGGSPKAAPKILKNYAKAINTGVEKLSRITGINKLDIMGYMQHARDLAETEAELKSALEFPDLLKFLPPEKVPDIGRLKKQRAFSRKEMAKITENVLDPQILSAFNRLSRHYGNVKRLSDKRTEDLKLKNTQGIDWTIYAHLWDEIRSRIMGNIAENTYGLTIPKGQLHRIMQSPLIADKEYLNYANNAIPLDQYLGPQPDELLFSDYGPISAPRYHKKPKDK